MRPFVAALLLLITAWVIVIDPVVCPDGCADAPAGAAVTVQADGDGALPAPEVARAVCLFCLGVTATHAAAPVLAPGLRVEAVSVAAIPPAPLPPSHDIDHPPRIV